MTQVDGDWTQDTLTLALAHGQLRLVAGAATPEPTAATLYLTGTQLVGLDAAPTKATVTRTLQIRPSALEPQYLSRLLAELAQAAKLKLETAPTAKLPASQRATATAYWAELAPLLMVLGVSLAPAPKRPAKAQHRWKAAVATVPFTTDWAGTQATVYWRKRNELMLLAGAQMKPEADLNADGSLGFDARFAAQLRHENADAFDPQTFTTTRDLVLKSVNEVGLFLYFGNTNSWLQLKDAAGKTIEDWTIVK
ncbi:hypothetical protein [Lacticaseibacillus absianus]|uniref:hypothetical protein n=1 Tax=Lacticaseibacillus absianus TaxID=2729623 RepID=UPI0015C8F4F9|nr:hypothetical protein [Lacticaseibacillus absianus]